MYREDGIERRVYKVTKCRFCIMKWVSRKLECLHLYTWFESRSVLKGVYTCILRVTINLALKAYTWILYFYAAPIDGEGIIPDELERRLETYQLTRAKERGKGQPFSSMLYLIPTFHNPTGACLSPGMSAVLHVGHGKVWIFVNEEHLNCKIHCNS